MAAQVINQMCPKIRMSVKSKYDYDSTVCRLMEMNFLLSIPDWQDSN